MLWVCFSSKYPGNLEGPGDFPWSTSRFLMKIWREPATVLGSFSRPLIQNTPPKPTPKSSVWCCHPNPLSIRRRGRRESTTDDLGPWRIWRDSVLKSCLRFYKLFKHYRRKSQCCYIGKWTFNEVLNAVPVIVTCEGFFSLKINVFCKYYKCANNSGSDCKHKANRLTLVKLCLHEDIPAWPANWIQGYFFLKDIKKGDHCTMFLIFFHDLCCSMTKWQI